MRKGGLAAVVVVILVAAALGVAYLATTSAPHGRSSSTMSTFSFRTTLFSTSYSTTVNSGVTTTFAIRVTSTVDTTWVPGQPIPASMVETENFFVPDGNAYLLDPSTNRIYVLGTSSLSVVDASSHMLIADVHFPRNNTGGSINAGLAIDASTHMVYASVHGEVVKVNGSTNTVAGEIPLGLRALAINPTTRELWGTLIRERDLGAWGPVNASLVDVDVRTGLVVKNVSIGFQPYGIAVDLHTNMVYADGCIIYGLVCNPHEAIVNGTSGAVLATVQLGSPPSMALDPATHVIYLSGEQELAAINGITGQVLFHANPQACGPFYGMVVDPSANLVYMGLEVQDSNYLLAYDGATGSLVNMYSFENPVLPIAFNSNYSQLYVHTAGHTVALHPLSDTGNVNIGLIAPRGDCPLP